MKSNLKKTLASVAAVCIASSMMIPMGASAGQMLGQTDFENGICLPWHTCESATAKMEFDIEGGSFNVTIVEPGGEANGGEDRWDCQVRHRGLNMQAGQKYHLHFELTPSNSGEFYTKIGNLNGDIEVWHNGSHDSSDFGQYWNPIQVSANQTYVMDVEFTPTETVEVAEWAFHLGGGGSVTGTTGKVCFPAGTVLKFDNMSLECLTSDEWDYVALAQREMTGISLNQVGYYANRTKKATIDTGLISGTDFTINDANGGVVYSGTLGSAKADADSGNTVAIADFSEVRTAGTYTLTVGGVTSDPFQIFDSQGGTYKEMTQDALNYFFLNRGNQNTESKYISGAYADETVTYNNKPIYNSVEEHAEALTITGSAVRNTDTAYIQDIWKDDYAFNGSDVITSKNSIDVTGGWYDAGDYGKYVVNGGISVWTLQNIYERAIANGTESTWASGSDYMYIPESESNSTPDILDEAAVELDWFIDCMQRADGMVYHKTHDYKWTALATLPSQDVGPDGKTSLIRIVKPVTYAATLNLAATGAQGYRVWKDVDSARAEKYLAAAEKAYDAAKKLYDSGATTDPTTSEGASLYAPLDQNVGGGPYGDTEISDDFYWAACELFAATGDSKYETDLKSYSQALEVVTSLEGGENSGSFSSFNWGCTASLGTLSLALNTMGTVSDADVQSAKASTVKAAQTYINKENEQGYGIPYQQATYKDGDNTITGYEWGSNSFVVNNAIVMAYAYDFTGDGDYVDGVTTAMDYLLGRNPMENSYVTGYGTFYTKYVHHRYWSFLIDPTFPLAPAGVLSGGPNSAVQDPYAKGAGYKPGETAPQKAYIDHIEAWSTNECTINWNAPLSWVVSFMEDTYNAPIGDGDLTDIISDAQNPNKPDTGSDTDTTTTASDSKVDITDSSLELEVGEDKALSVSGDVDKFESSNPSVATVDSTGKVTGIAKGEATITVTGKDGSTDTITVTVTESATTGDVTTPAQSGDTTTATDTDVTTSGDGSVTTSPAIDGNNKWGDVDCNGEVNAVDVLMLKKYLLTMLTAEDIGTQGMANADVTHDGDVTAPDLVKLKKFVLTMIEEADLAVSGS